MGRNGRTFNGKEEHLCSGLGAKGAAPALLRAGHRAGSSPGTPAATSIHGTAQGRAGAGKSALLWNGIELRPRVGPWEVLK